MDSTDERRTGAPFSVDPVDSTYSNPAPEVSPEAAAETYVEPADAEAGSAADAAARTHDAAVGRSTKPAGATPFPDAAAEWSRTHRVDVDGISVRYRQAGTGPAVLLAHGLGMSADYWWRNGPELAAAGYRVLAPDFPGFGRTGKPGRGITVTESARFLAGFLDALTVENAVAVGHSLSCQAVLQLAADAPDHVRALILASPTGDRRRGKILREAAGFVADAFREPASLVPIVADAYFRTTVRHYAGTLRAASKSDAFQILPRVQAPGIVIVGSRDPIVPVPFAHALARALPRGHLTVIRGGAHAVIYDRAARFNRVVLAWLKRELDARGSPLA
jgi:2-hydroxy-6-oxonona-2,4-dienedioate hydrolase